MAEKFSYDLEEVKTTSRIICAYLKYYQDGFESINLENKDWKKWLFEVCWS